jgi:hypothetical protein
MSVQQQPAAVVRQASCHKHGKAIETKMGCALQNLDVSEGDGQIATEQCAPDAAAKEGHVALRVLEETVHPASRSKEQQALQTKCAASCAARTQFKAVIT